MITILLDSSNTRLNVGLAINDTLIDETSYEAWQQQSEYMVDELDKLLTKNNYVRSDISDVMVAIGPGSYTGVRISLTIAKVIGLALNVPVYEVSSLHILKDNDKPSICVINARSNRSYFGVYCSTGTIEKDQIKTNEEVKEYIAAHKDYSIMGDARYLGYSDNTPDVLEQMLSLKNSIIPNKDPISIKPVYMKD